MKAGECIFKKFVKCLQSARFGSHHSLKLINFRNTRNGELKSSRQGVAESGQQWKKVFLFLAPCDHINYKCEIRGFFFFFLSITQHKHLLTLQESSDAHSLPLHYLKTQQSRQNPFLIQGALNGLRFQQYTILSVFFFGLSQSIHEDCLNIFIFNISPFWVFEQRVPLAIF